MIRRSLAAIAFALAISACAPPQRNQPAPTTGPATTEPTTTEPSPPVQPEPQLPPEPQPEPAPEPGLEPTVEPAPEAEPAAQAVPPPAWWFPEVRELESDAILAPGIADAPTLLQARTAALAVARARVDLAAANWPDARADEAVRNAASATLPDGTYRYWVILYAQPRR